MRSWFSTSSFDFLKSCYMYMLCVHFVDFLIFMHAVWILIVPNDQLETSLIKLEKLKPKDIVCGSCFRGAFVAIFVSGESTGSEEALFCSSIFQATNPSITLPLIRVKTPCLFTSKMLWKHYLNLLNHYYIPFKTSKYNELISTTTSGMGGHTFFCFVCFFTDK